MKLRISLTWILFLFIIQAHAQVAPVLPNLSNWQQLSSDNFDILFLPSNRAIAEKTARYAEISLQEISELFDYNPQSRYTLYLVYDHPQLAMTHLMLNEVPLRPGFFKVGQKHAYVAYPGTSAKLFGAVKSQIANLLLAEFTYGKRMKQTIQGQTLLNYAPWYSQGMADYVGNGWDYEDEMWLNTLASDHIEEILDLALEGDGPTSARLRKSVWRYVGHEYGDQKIAEIIYFVNISGSLEAGIISVLGITLNTLTGRWRENLREIAASNSSGRNSLGKMPGLQEIPLLKDHEILQFAYHPSQNQYALYLNKGGKHELVIYTPESGAFTTTSITSSQANPVTTDSETSYPLEWSKDGQTLFTTVYEGTQYKIVWYDVKNKKARYQLVPGHIHHIRDADWSHNGRLLTVSALHGSSPQIFILKVNENQFIPVTDDPYDNIHPSWSYDDEVIFFSSNRDTNLVKIENRKLDSRNLFFDIYSYQRAEKTDTLAQHTFTPETNEFRPQAPNSFELIFLTDESGINNLKKKNIILNQETYLTDIHTGLLDYQASEEKLVFTTPIKGKSALFGCKLDAIQPQALPELSLLRTEKLTSYAQARRELAEINRRKALLANASEKTETPDQNPETKNPEPKTQTPEPETPPEEKKVRYYIFDDYEEPYEVKEAENNIFDKREKEINQQKQSLLSASLPSKVPDYDKIKVGKTQSVRQSWNIDYLSLEVGRRPDAGLFTRLGGRISDRFHNQEIEAYAAPFVDFRNFNGRNGQFQFKYTNLKRRVDYYVGTDLLVRHYRRINTLFPLDSAIYRYDNLAIQAGVRYPITNYSAVSLEGAFHFLERRDQKLLNQVLADQSDRVVKLGATYEYDKTTSQEGYTLKGWKGEVSFNSYHSIAQRSSLFNTAAFHVSKYTEIKNRIVLANKLVGGYSFGNKGQRFYIGGTQDWIPPYIFFSDSDARLSKENALQTDLTDFSFQEFITPMRGFWFYSRSGSRYFALSSELRIPISRLTKTALNSSPLYNLEVIPFVDVGSVWSSGNPFSSTNPTDTRLVGTEPVIVVLRTLRSPFVIGVGSGIRTNFLGYSIRVDLGWGIEDALVEKMAISLSLGRNF